MFVLTFSNENARGPLAGALFDGEGAAAAAAPMAAKIHHVASMPCIRCVYGSSYNECEMDRCAGQAAGERAEAMQAGGGFGGAGFGRDGGGWAGVGRTEGAG